MQKKSFHLLFIILFLTSQAHASAVIQRRKQMAQQQQAIAQKKAEAQAQQQRQAQGQAMQAAQRKKQMQMQAYRQKQQMQQQRAYGRGSTSTTSVIEDEALELHEIWGLFEEKSDLWAYMVDDAPKIKTVERYITAYRNNGIYISKDVAYYVTLIDGMSQGNPALLNSPFADVLKFVAIMEYDFDNGQDKDIMARRLLGEKIYQSNKKRLGL